MTKLTPRQVAGLLALALVAATTSTARAEVVTYEFTGTATSKTGIFAAEATNVVTGTVSFDSGILNFSGGSTEEDSFFASFDPTLFVNPSIVFTLGSITLSEPVDNSHETSVLFVDGTLDLVRITNRQLDGQPEQVQFQLFTGLEADGISTGGTFLWPDEIPGSPGTGALADSLTIAGDLPILDNPNFLDGWSAPTGFWQNSEFGSITSEVQFTWDSFRRQPGDADSDGIEDGIDGEIVAGSFDDQSAIFSDAFTDEALAGTTFGQITDRSDMTFVIGDDPAAGVNIATTGGSGIASVQVCGFATLNLTDGDTLALECGSVMVEVFVGPVEVTLDEETTVTIPAETSAAITETGEGSYLIENTSPAGTGGDVVVTVGATDTNIGPGESGEFGVQEVAFDVRSAGAGSCLKLNGRGQIPVSIFGSAEVDVADIDPATLALNGLGVTLKKNGTYQCNVAQLGGSGHPDLNCHFEDDLDAFNGVEDQFELTGALNDGSLIQGVQDGCVDL